MNLPGHRYFAIYKPFKMVSQFISPHKVGLLGDLDFDFPPGTHAIGRLDNDSEGLLLLTTDKKVTRLLFLSETPHKRTYLVQINNTISNENLHRLRNGVNFKIKNEEVYTTTPCDAQVIDDPAALYLFPERLTAYDPYTWLLITITEGKYHQVRKMIGSIKHKVKRLIRVSIEDLSLGTLKAGQIKEMEREEFYRKLKI